MRFLVPRFNIEQMSLENWQYIMIYTHTWDPVRDIVIVDTEHDDNGLFLILCCPWIYKYAEDSDENNSQTTFTH